MIFSEIEEVNPQYGKDGSHLYESECGRYRIRQSIHLDGGISLDRKFRLMIKKTVNGNIQWSFPDFGQYEFRKLKSAISGAENHVRGPAEVTEIMSKKPRRRKR